MTPEYDPRAIIEQFPWWAQYGIARLNSQPILLGLLIAMVIDVASGIVKAVVEKNLNSTTSVRGMTKKIGMLLVIGLCALIEPVAGGIPLVKIASLFYTVAEAISIVENLAAAGVPMPKALIDILSKMKKEEEAPPKGITVQFPPSTHFAGAIDTPAAPTSTPVGSTVDKV